MFTKKPDQKDGDEVIRPAARTVDPGPKPEARPPAASSGPPALSTTSRQSSVIGDELRVVGNVSSEGELQVEGVIEGDIRCSCLIINPTARIVGEVVAEDVIVNGQLLGDVRGLRVTLQSNANVQGDIIHGSLAIEDGACFEGASRRSEDPLGEKDDTPAKSAPSGNASAQVPEPPESGASKSRLSAAAKSKG